MCENDKAIKATSVAKHYEKLSRPNSTVCVTISKFKALATKIKAFETISFLLKIDNFFLCGEEKKGGGEDGEMLKYFLLRQNLLMMFCLGGGTGKEDLLQIFEISDFKNMSNCTNNKNSS